MPAWSTNTGVAARADAGASSTARQPSATLSSTRLLHRFTAASTASAYHPTSLLVNCKAGRLCGPCRGGARPQQLAEARTGNDGGYTLGPRAPREHPVSADRPLGGSAAAPSVVPKRFAEQPHASEEWRAGHLARGVDSPAHQPGQMVLPHVRGDVRNAVSRR